MRLQCNGIGWEPGDKIEKNGKFWLLGWCCVYLGVNVVGCDVSLVEIQETRWSVLQIMSGKGDLFALILPKEMRDAIE